MYQPQLIEVDPHRIKFNPKNPRKYLRPFGKRTHNSLHHKRHKPCY